MDELATTHRTVFIDAQTELQTVAVERVTARSQTGVVGVQLFAADRAAVVGQSSVASWQRGQCVYCVDAAGYREVVAHRDHRLDDASSSDYGHRRHQHPSDDAQFDDGFDAEESVFLVNS